MPWHAAHLHQSARIALRMLAVVLSFLLLSSSSSSPWAPAGLTVVAAATAQDRGASDSVPAFNPSSPSLCLDDNLPPELDDMDAARKVQRRQEQVTPTLTCPDGKAYNTLALPSASFTPGFYAIYWPGPSMGTTNTQMGAPGSSLPKKGNYAKVNFARIESRVEVAANSSDASNTGPGAVANWNTTFSPAARLGYNWADFVYVQWEFRFIAPCSGSYTFQTLADDGAALFVSGLNSNNDLWGSVSGLWGNHKQQSAISDSYTLQAGKVYSGRMIGFDNIRQFVQMLMWKIPGQSSYTFIDSTYAVAFRAPSVYVSRNNVIAFKAKNGVEFFEVVLSDKPTGIVTVTINNDAGKTMFAFDKCQLVFSQNNWNVPQRVYSWPIPGAPLPNDAVIPVALVPTKDSTGKSYQAGRLQVVNPTAGALGMETTCTGWGDPHYTTWDGAHFNFYGQGHYLFARDVNGTFAVYTHLLQCGTGATVSCTRRVYLYYKCPTCTKGAFYVMWFNPEKTDFGYTDRTIFMAKLAGDNDDGVSITRPPGTTNILIFNLPGPITLRLVGDAWKTWLPPSEQWRYFNVHVTVRENMLGKVTGLCGPYNKNTTDDPVVSATLDAGWRADPNVFIPANGSTLSPISIPYTPSANTISVDYSTDKNLDQLTMDTRCSQPPAPSTPVDPTPPALLRNLPPPPEKETPNYTPGTFPPPASVITYCTTLISRANCPGSNSSIVPDSQLTSLRTQCSDEIMALGLQTNPGLSAPMLTNVTSALQLLAPSFAAMCADLKTTLITQQCAAQCTDSQTCNTNNWPTSVSCVNTNICGTVVCQNGGTCNADATCQCTAAYTGEDCSQDANTAPCPTTCASSSQYVPLPYYNTATQTAASCCQNKQSCTMPSASVLGSYLRISGSTGCTAGGTVAPGGTCTVACGALSTTTTSVTITCQNWGQFDRDINAIVCNTTCANANTDNYGPGKCTAPQFVNGPNMAQACVAGSAALATSGTYTGSAPLCTTSTCCTGLPQCGAAQACNSTTQYLVQANAAQYCNPAVTNDCQSKCCAPLQMCPGTTASPSSNPAGLPVYSCLSGYAPIAMGTNKTCTLDASSSACQSTCCVQVNLITCQAASTTTPAPFTCSSGKGVNTTVTCQMSQSGVQLVSPACNAATCCFNLPKCSASTVCNAATQYVNATVANEYCNPTIAGSCDKCCIPKNVCPNTPQAIIDSLKGLASYTCPHAYSPKSGTEGMTCTDDTNCTATCCQRDATCPTPDMDDLGPYITIPEPGCNHSVNTVVTAGTTCTYTCPAGSTGTTVGTCQSGAFLSPNTTVCSMTCGVASALSPAPFNCAGPSLALNSATTCQIGTSDAVLTGPACNAGTCCRSLPQCSTRCNAATQYVNATVANDYCDPTVAGSCDKCCIPKRVCPDTPDANNPNGLANYTCPPGYIPLSGTMGSKCTDNANCTAVCCTIDCPVPMASNLGPYVTIPESACNAAVNTDIPAGTTCTYTCPAGSTGSTVATCQTTGQMSTNVTLCSMTCGVASALSPTPFTCSSPSQALNTATACQVGTVNSVPTPACNAGTCCRNLPQCGTQCTNANTQYVNMTAQNEYCDPTVAGSCSKCCIPKRVCPLTPPASNPDSLANYTCPAGYMPLSGSMGSTCKDEGHCLATCCVKACPAPMPINLGTYVNVPEAGCNPATDPLIPQGTTCTYTCPAGSTGTTVSTCQANSQMSPNSAVCSMTCLVASALSPVPFTCSGPSQAVNSSATCQMGTPNAVLTGPACNAGTCCRSLPKCNAPTVCDAGTQYVNTTVKNEYCDPTVAGSCDKCCISRRTSPLSPTNPSPSLPRFTCPSGYGPRPGTQGVTCTDDVNCLATVCAKQCPLPMGGPNVIGVDVTLGTDKLGLGESGQVTCAPGSDPVKTGGASGTTTYTCGANGIMSATPTLQCKPRCPIPMTPGINIVSTGGANGCQLGGTLQYGASCTVACDADSVSTNGGTNTYTCGDNRQLTATPSLQCRKTCDLPATLGPNRANVNCALGGQLAPGGSCKIACAAGSLPLSPSASTYEYRCGSDGTFSAVPNVDCRKTCPVPMTPSDLYVPAPGTANAGNCTVGGSLAFGQSCTVDCKTGTVPAGPASRTYTCGDNGKLSATPTLTCEYTCEVPMTFGANVVPNSCTRGDTLLAGESCSVKCASAYTARPGTTTVYQCGADGKLVAPTLICDPAKFVSQVITPPPVEVERTSVASAAGIPLPRITIRPVSNEGPYTINFRLNQTGNWRDVVPKLTLPVGRTLVNYRLQDRFKRTTFTNVPVAVVARAPKPPPADTIPKIDLAAPSPGPMVVPKVVFNDPPGVPTTVEITLVRVEKDGSETPISKLPPGTPVDPLPPPGRYRLKYRSTNDVGVTTVDVPFEVPNMGVACPILLPIWAAPGANSISLIPADMVNQLRAPPVTFGRISPTGSGTTVTINGQPVSLGNSMVPVNLPVGNHWVQITVNDVTRSGVSATCRTPLQVVGTCNGPSNTPLASGYRYSVPTTGPGKPPGTLRHYWCSRNTPNTWVSCCQDDCSATAYLIPPELLCMEHNKQVCQTHGTSRCNEPDYRKVCPKTCKVC